MTAQTATPDLFTIDDANADWSTLRAAGFANPAVGHIRRDATTPAICGVPLGGVDNGCVDLETSGLWGYATIFNSLAPRRDPINTPALGLSVDGNVWLLSTLRHKQSEDEKHVLDAMRSADAGERYAPDGLKSASDIAYWGHYPVADLAFETDAPVQASARFFAPFIPGDVEDSMLPGIVVEVRLTNTSDAAAACSLAFSFDGPLEVEAGDGARVDEVLETDGWRGLRVGTADAEIVVAAIDEADVRTGAALAHDWEAWKTIANELPSVGNNLGGSCAVDATIEPGETRTIRYMLTWRSPQWRGGGHPGAADTNYFLHMYATRYATAIDAANDLAARHDDLLRRVLAWQSAIYDETDYPAWLRDTLVNILHLITEDGVWAAKTDTFGAWLPDGGGLFGLNESPRACPQIECLPCSWYGSLPLVYFFPELALSSLRGYKEYQDEEGSPPWVFGGITTHSPPYEMSMPHRGYQVAQNPTNYMDMFDRAWMHAKATGAVDADALAREFYPSLKRTTDFMIGMNSREDGIISFPDHRVTHPDCRPTSWETEAFEHCEWHGMATHLGAMKLAHLKMMKRLAEAVDDNDYAAQCQAWFEQGSRSLETKLWAGNYYLNFWEEATELKMDSIFGYQLDGQWMADLHGVEPVFQTDRITTVLDTIRNANGKHSDHGVINFCNPDGSAMDPDQGFLQKNYKPYDFFTPEALMLGMTYLYRGDRDYGMHLGERCMRSVAVQCGRMWDQPNILNGETGDAKFGSDYYQNLVVWSFPAAIGGTDLGEACGPGSLVDRVLKAGARTA